MTCGSVVMSSHCVLCTPETDEDREEALSTGGLDLILVPGLAFTKVCSLTHVSQFRWSMYHGDAKEDNFWNYTW